MFRGTRDAERIDPIVLEVFRHRLDAIADEMGVALARAAYSTNVKTRLDFSCAIFDDSLRMISQSFAIPIHLGSLTHYVPKIVEDYGMDALVSGDILICNDGYRGGVHLNDVVVVAPVVVEDGTVAYVAALAHQVDVGGSNPGSIGLTVEIFQEGLIIPPTRLVHGGEFDHNILGLILNNVRSPKECGGDLRAQVAAANTGIRRVVELCEDYGAARVKVISEELLNYTERRVRHEIASIPNGVYQAEGFLDDDGVSSEPVRVVVKITVDDETVVFDLRDSDKQRRGPINATYAMSLSNCAYTLRALMDPDLPTNDGFYRTVKVLTLPGTVADARHPAAIGGGWETGFRICETAFQAIAEAVPERIAAGSKGCLANIMFGTLDPATGEYLTFFESVAGGYGARATKDGMDAVQPHVQNTENSPVEEMESGYPIRVLRYELVKDSEGAGRFRGGLGLRRDYVFDHETMFSVLADRAKFEPWGLGGGHPAPPAQYIRDPEREPDVYGSKFAVTLDAGEVFRVQMAGGGGYGPPHERDPHLVLEDVLDGKVSLERAREVYAVAIDPEAEAVDSEATETLRRTLPGATLKQNRKA